MSCFRLAREPKGGEEDVALQFNFEMLKPELWEEITKAKLIPMIQEKQLKVTEIQVPIRVYHYSSNMRYLLKAFQEHLTTLSLENTVFEESPLKLDVTFDYPLDEVNMKIWQDNFFDMHDFKGQLIRASNLNILTPHPFHIDHLKHFQISKKLGLQIQEKDLEQILQAFSSLSQSNSYRQTLEKVLIQGKHGRPITPTDEQQEIMKELNIKLEKCERDMRESVVFTKSKMYAEKIEGKEEKQRPLVGIKDVIEHLNEQGILGHRAVYFDISHENSSLDDIQQLSNKLNSLQPAYSVKKIELAARTVKDKIFLQVAIDLENAQRQICTINLTTTNLPLFSFSAFIQHDSSLFLNTLPHFNELETLSVDSIADTYNSMNQISLLANEMLKRGSRLKKLGIRYQCEEKQRNLDKAIKIDQEQFEDNLKILQERIQQHCLSLTDLYLFNKDSPSLLPALATLSSTLPNLTTISVSRSFEDMYNRFKPTSLFNPKLQQITVLTEQCQNAYTGKAAFEGLTKAVEGCLNEGQRVRLYSANDEIDIDDFAGLMDKYEPPIWIDCKTVSYKMYPSKYSTELKRWTRILEIMDLIRKKY
ncbi:hypothetical protein FGO68_gene9468 [Halteria grandinella]|uniref:Uncharacterized protein n=1 Tax=Halteria grandinella TaxID=5974 RepID=A0A8J8T479_HALGN|nr:hypothetical protein FGO68_gene9468 [Halteria grandinella]